MFVLQIHILLVKLPHSFHAAVLTETAVKTTSGCAMGYSINISGIKGTSIVLNDQEEWDKDG